MFRASASISTTRVHRAVRPMRRCDDDEASIQRQRLAIPFATHEPGELEIALEQNNAHILFRSPARET